MKAIAEEAINSERMGITKKLRVDNIDCFLYVKTGKYK